MTDIISAIQALKADAQVSVGDENIKAIIWHDGNPTNITEKQILDKQAELKTAFNNLKYQRDRASEYPAIKDQLADRYHNGLDGWKKTIKAVKDKYPKG